MPIVRVSIGRRVFAPPWLLTALTIALAVAFVRLGEWQWDRGMLRQAQWDAFARGADRAVPLAGQSLEALPRFQRIEVTGSIDAEHQFLLDNRTYSGRAGYEILTPLTLEDGRTLLIDRGWVPFTGSRAQLPDVRVPAQQPQTRLTGRIDVLPVGGLALGRAPPPSGSSWPKVTSYPDMAELSQALARKLEPRILLLDRDAPLGYVRDWQPPGLPPARHWSYAIQWWGLAATLAVIWAVLSTRKTETGA